MILRELFTKLGLDVDAQSFAKGNLAVEAVKVGLEKLSAYVESTIEGWKEMVQGQAEAAERLHDTAQSTGLAADELQRLSAAAGIAGVSTETMQHGIMILSRTMAAAKAGGEEQGKAFASMGVKYKEADGHLRSAGDVLQDLADHFATLPDGAEKTAAAMKVLGRSGAELIPLLNLGGAEIEKLGAAANVMTDEQIEAGEHLIVVEKRLAIANEQNAKVLGRALLPAVGRLVEKYYKWRKASVDAMRPRVEWFAKQLSKAIDFLGRAFDFATKHAAKLGTIVAIGGGLALGITALIKLVDALNLAMLRTRAIALASGIKKWVIAAGPLLLLGLIIAGLVLAIEDLWVAAEGGKSVFGDLWPEWAKALVNWKQNTDGFWSGFWDDLVDGWKMVIGDFFDWLVDKAATVYNSTIGRLTGKVNTAAEQAAVDQADRQLAAREEGAPGSARYMAAMGYKYAPQVPAAATTGAPTAPGGMIAPAAGGRTTIVQHTKHVTVHANGVDPAGVLRAIKEHMDTSNEETLAAVGDG